MAMTLAALGADLLTSLHDAGELFRTDPGRLIGLAVEDLHRVRPLVRTTSLDLLDDALLTGCYRVPADFVAIQQAHWGVGHGIPPWSLRYPGALPRACSVRTDAGLALQLSPPPTPHQISVLGRQYRYSYYARHQIGAIEPDSTVSPADRGLLLLRAQAEACRELAARNVVKPLALRDGFSRAPANGTPAALWQLLMAQFEGARR